MFGRPATTTPMEEMRRFVMGRKPIVIVVRLIMFVIIGRLILTKGFAFPISGINPSSLHRPLKEASGLPFLKVFPYEHLFEPYTQYAILNK
jgi:hypothetical protein